ncbi:gfo/Idh/MocA family oxidoreductase [Mesobacillus boroniphilus]|uniref:Gfo/Idh/MocA family oxidoreductase n=1 Tax=Mesobacillus boroniphilus TaxID=308892 RepID=A0A944CPF3_9BACI|nr:Gfo/Idh/MocA family oxidoreductase [Mesobacillus boroniphilus]MBS8266441.1 gfo/Idh/MocA family oxidoreductase [Mesobacillus boroniphilus]
MDERVIKWGILGTGLIASAFARDLAFAKNTEKAAVGSRTKESAARFAEEHGVSRAYGSYEELVQDPDVDAIYVATPHPFHKENVLACLRAGKAVLCEKPFTINSGELDEIIQFARDKKLFLMEAMWTRFLPPIVKVREWIDSGKIGDVLLVKADFGYRAHWDPEWRLLNPALGGGALLDIGIYPVSLASMIFGTKPEKILSTAHIGETGVDEQFSIIMSYPAGKTATLNGAFRVGLTNEAYIHGTEGYIRIPSFHSAKSATLYKDGEEAETFNDDRKSAGYAFEIEEVGKCLSQGLLESSVIPLDESLEIMKLMDEIRGQWGLKYPFE